MGIASRCRRCCAAIETIGDGFLRHVGPCYVMLGCGLVSMVAYSLLYIVLPLTKDLHTWFGLGTFIAVAFVFFNIGFNYLMSVRVAPGSPTTREVQVLCAEAGAAVRRWCQTCQCPKPDLTHHCSICKKCVLKMDHHCPWIHNCVGHRNYRYFFNFLMWLWLGCITTVVHTGSVAVGGKGLSVFGLAVVGGGGDMGLHSVPDRLGSNGVNARAGITTDTQMHTRSFTTDERSTAIFSCLLAVSVFLAMCGLWGWHVYLVLTAQTSIDYHYFSEKRKEFKKRGEVYVNPHDMGMKRNWQNVFDEKGRYWWILWAMPRVKPHRGTGVPICVEG